MQSCARLHLFGNENLFFLWNLGRFRNPYRSSAAFKFNGNRTLESTLAVPDRAGRARSLWEFVPASASLVWFGGVIFCGNSAAAQPGARLVNALEAELALLREPRGAVPAHSAGSSQPGTKGLISLCNVCSQSQDFNYIFPLLASS